MSVTGPRDVTDAGDTSGLLDLGGMLITPVEGVDVQVQADEATGAITQVTCVAHGGGVQVHPYAAPRSGGMWDDIRGQIRSSITAGGGLVEDADGPFGTELRAQVPPQDGSTGLQPARFAGIDGPRWFLRAVFIGAAARPGEAADALEALVRGIVVRRGTEAMAVGTPLPLRLPGSVPAGPAVAERPVVRLPERGPEITETR